MRWGGGGGRPRRRAAIDRLTLADDEGDAAPENLATAEGRERAWEASSDRPGGMGGSSGARGGLWSATRHRGSPESAVVSGGGGEESGATEIS